MKSILAPLALFPLALAACCCPNYRSDPGPPPPPLTKADQLVALNARAKQVQTLKARGSVSITWTDDKGTHSNSTDAVILLHQRAPVHPYDPGVDVLLQGKVAGSEVFEMGVNATDHWLAFKVDPNTAYVGPMNVPPSNTSRAPLRADRVLTVLALSQLGERDDTRIAMTINGEAGGPHVNEIHIIRFATGWGAFIERTYVINRHSGDITEIRSYFPDGRVESVARLTYKPGTQITMIAPPNNTNAPSSAPRFPSQIVIDDPADKSHIELTMDSYDVNPTLSPKAFETPDFAKQGLKVLPAD